VSFQVDTEGVVVNIDAGKEFMINPSRDILARLGEILGTSRVELQ